MANNQSHGKDYENYIKKAFPKSLSYECSPTSPWDILKDFDEELGLPTSVKTSKRKNISLADARKFFLNFEKFRLVVGFYSQSGNIKKFKEIREYIVDEEQLIILKGELTFTDVELFHNVIKSYKEKDSHPEARKTAKEIKKQLQNKKTFIKLHPKIDSKGQRRLQCSIDVDALELICKPNVFTDSYKGLSPVIEIESSPREFSSVLTPTIQILE